MEVLFALCLTISLATPGAAEIESKPSSNIEDEEQSNPVNLIRALLAEDADGSRRKTVAERMTAFTWERNRFADGKSFVDPEVIKKDASLPQGSRDRDRDVQAALRWVERKTNDASTLYYLLVDSKLPDWMSSLTESQKDLVRGGGRFKADLIAGLDRWTVHPRSAQAPPDWIQVFLADAANETRIILSATDRLPKDVAEEMRDRDGGAVSPGATRSREASITFSAPPEKKKLATPPPPPREESWWIREVCKIVRCD